MNKKTLGFLFLVAVIVGLIAYSMTEQKTPAWEFMPDMYESTSFKAQKEDPYAPDGAAARLPPDGTVPRGYQPYHFMANETLRAGSELMNPLPSTRANLERGQKVFNTYCIVCHGPKGNGEGFIVPPYPRPPSLLSDKIVGYKDGSIFHIITMGQNLMPSYRTQIKPEDRWAVVNYVRVLQKADRPTDADIQAMKGQAQ